MNSCIRTDINKTDSGQTAKTSLYDYFFGEEKYMDEVNAYSNDVFQNLKNSVRAARPHCNNVIGTAIRDDCCCDTTSNNIWITTSNSTSGSLFYQRVIDRMNKYFPHQDNNELVRKAFIKRQIANSPETNKECYIPTEEEVLKRIAVCYDVGRSCYKLSYFYSNRSFVHECIESSACSSEDEVRDFLQKAKEHFAKHIIKQLSDDYKEEQPKMYNLNEQQLDSNIKNLVKMNGSIEIEGSIHTYNGKTTITIPTCMLDFVRIIDPKFLEPACACIAPTLTPTNRINIPKAGIPNVSRVETYNNRVVKVVFADGTYTKAVCSENDTFDLDTGITICIMKRFFGKDNKTGTREYNRLIRNVHDTMDRNEKERERLAKEKAEHKEKQKKLEQKRIAGREAARQEYIDDIAAGVEQALSNRERSYCVKADDGK